MFSLRVTPGSCSSDACGIKIAKLQRQPPADRAALYTLCDHTRPAHDRRMFCRAHPGSDGRCKVDFHLHSAEDPLDVVHYSAADLLRRAKQLGFHAVAVTLHGHALIRPELFLLAEELEILLIPGAELRIEGADVVVLNLTEAEALATRRLADLRTLRASRGKSIFILAPHPFFYFGGSIGHRLADYIDCFDALEYSHFHTRWVNLNAGAVAAAARYHKPLLATSDAHRLDFFGDHYSLVEAGPEPDAEALFDAIRNGRLERVSPAWPTRKFVRYLSHIFATHPVECLLHKIHYGK